MVEHDIANDYYIWLYNLVCDDKTHHKLFSFLHSVPFTYSLPMDANRQGDGESLRYRFADWAGIDDRIIRSVLDIMPCSVLEMMIALAIRCEESLMHDADIGNRTRDWFWLMLDNLELDAMSDDHFDMVERSEKVNKFMQRKYDRCGHGGLFVIPNCTKDMRTIEIWIQMMLYLNTIIRY